MRIIYKIHDRFSMCFNYGKYVKEVIVMYIVNRYKFQMSRISNREYRKQKIKYCLIFYDKRKNFVKNRMLKI